MSYFEANSLIHRNLRAKHVLVAADGTVKIGGYIFAQRIDYELGYGMGQGIKYLAAVHCHSRNKICLN